MAFSLAGVAVTATRVTSFATVAVYCTVFPVNAGESVPGEMESAFKELSADKFSAAAFWLLPPAVLSALSDAVLPAVPVLPVVSDAALLTLMVVLLPSMESNSWLVSNTTPSEAATATLQLPAPTAFKVTVKLSEVAVTLLPPPP